MRCVYSGREVPCERPMKPGTRATAKCKQHYKETFRPEYSSLLCQENGDWSYPLFYCTPGTSSSTPSISSQRPLPNIFVVVVTSPEMLKEYLKVLQQKYY